MKHCNITFLPEGKGIAIHQGASLLEAAGQVGIILNSPCGGQGICRKCRVLIGTAKEPALACQTKVFEDLEVWIPPESRFIRQQILEHGIRREMTVSARICKKFLPSPPATPEDVLQNLSDSLAAQATLHSEVFWDESRLASPGGLTAVLVLTGNNYELLCLESGDTQNILYGVCVDIGTTTLVLQLLDLLSGKILQTASSANPQIRYGDDVIGRIHHGQTKEGLGQLHQCLIRRLNELIAEVCRKQGIDSEQIYEMTAVGNTTMHHLLHEYPVVQLGQIPYNAYSIAAEDRNAKKAGIRIHPAGRLYTLENIAGFVGSDTVAAALAAGLDTAEQVCLLVDIGTNGELVLGTKDRLVSASCAAGPALEGARILFGSRAEDGAIQRVLTNDQDLILDVIGSIPAKTICGSGLIDAVATMLDLGVIGSNGGFSEKKILESRVSQSITERIIEYRGQPAFVLAWKESSSEPSVVLTQKDIREVQLAKAAISAGIRLLLKTMGLTEKQIERLYLAGAFGNYIQKRSAIRIGLLPNIPEGKIHFIGNAAGSGAYMSLINRQCRQTASDLARRIQYIEIARERDFQDVFAESILFP